MQENQDWLQKHFLWNKYIPLFPPLYWWDGKLYLLEGIFKRYDHFHNGSSFKGYVARYRSLLNSA